MRYGWMARNLALVVVGLLGGLPPVAAQTFDSGSTGADGVFNPPSTVPPGTTVNGSTYTVPLPPSGIFHFTTITIPSGSTVKFARNATNTPVTLLAAGGVTIAGILDLNGSAGAAYQTTTATYPTGGKGAPAALTAAAGRRRSATASRGTGWAPAEGRGRGRTARTTGVPGAVEDTWRPGAMPTIAGMATTGLAAPPTGTRPSSPSSGGPAAAGAGQSSG